MKYFFDDIFEVEKLIQKNEKVILLLDFDGVLSAIASRPEAAVISKKILRSFKKCAAFFPTAVISGRELNDIKKKINIKGLFYIASHGLEWERDGKYYAKKIPKKTVKAINLAKQKITPLADRYPRMIFEEKYFTFAIHYRMMNPKLAGFFIKEVLSILEPIATQNKLRVDHNLKTFELRPAVNWDKGDGALFAERYFNKKMKSKCTPIYIGDGLTDEDAFIALAKSGITIRVGQNKNSKAKWYLHNQREVSVFLGWMLSRLGGLKFKLK